MGFMGNSINNCRLQVVLKENTVIDVPIIIATLADHAFKPIDETADERSVGWVDMFDNSLTAFDISGRVHLGNYLAFALRVDQRRIPGAVFREAVKNASAEWLSRNPGFIRIPKKAREDIKDAVKANLLTKTLPVPTIYDVIWNLATNIITFCNIGTRGMDSFDTLFKKSFPECRLQYITPYDRAMEVAIKAKDEILLQQIVAENKATTESILDKLNANNWLGHDLLLWLLYMKQDGGMVTPELTAYINDKILLAGSGESGIQKISFSGDQSKLAAVKTALEEGKHIVSARIFMEAGDDQWGVTLRGDNFSFASFKSPAVHLEKTENDDELAEMQAVFFERVFLTQKGNDLFNMILLIFLKHRLSANWDDRQVDIKEWILS